MSNALQTLFQNAGGLIEMGLDEDTLAISGGTGGNKRISIDGGRFRKFVNGKEQSVNTDVSMNIIIVKAAHSPSRTFYSGSYKKGVKTSPVCWSNDSKVPDSDVTTPCAASCAECPNSVKGSGQGGQGSACRLSWRTAVVLANDPEGDVYQLVLPSTSVWGEEKNSQHPFVPYARMLANNNVSLGRVVTKMEFDMDFSVPKLMFAPVAAVSPELKEVVQRQSKSKAAESAIKLSVFKTDNPKGEESPEVAAASMPEPIKRETAKPAETPVSDVTDVLKKWSNKK